MASQKEFLELYDQDSHARRFSVNKRIFLELLSNFKCGRRNVYIAAGGILGTCLQHLVKQAAQMNGVSDSKVHVSHAQAIEFTIKMLYKISIATPEKFSGITSSLADIYPAILEQKKIFLTLINSVRTVKSKERLDILIAI